MSHTFDDRLTLLARATYPMALMLFVVPLMDVSIRVWPLRNSVSWRYGAVGLISSAPFTPLLAMLLILTAAVTLRHVRVALFVGVANALAALIGLLLMGIFALDAITVVATVVPSDQLSFLVAAAKAEVKLCIAVVVAASLGVSGVRAARAGRRGRA